MFILMSLLPEDKRYQLQENIDLKPTYIRAVNEVAPSSNIESNENIHHHKMKKVISEDNYKL